MSPVLTGGDADSTSPFEVAPPQVDSLSLVWHTDILVLAFFALFAVLTLPRFFTRFSRPSEWLDGHFFRSTKLLKQRYVSKTKNVILPPAESVQNRAAFASSDDSHTLNSHSHLIRGAAEKGKIKLDLPPHIQSWAGRCRRISSFLCQECVPGYCIGRSIIVLGYFFIVLYASVYKASLFADPARTGFVAMAQAPIVYALATKNNILGMALAIGYEKLNWLHRAVGVLVVLAANIHTLGYFYDWSIKGIFQETVALPHVIFGFISVLGLDIIIFFSTSFWRRKAYDVFSFTHVIGFILFPVGLVLHKPASLPYVLASIGVYVLDRIVRLFKTRLCEATIRPIPALEMTRVEIPRINAGWRAGQHVRLRVLSSSLGFFGIVESHPFTIANIGGDGMTLMCKKAGNWTNSLYDMAAQSEAAYSGTERGRDRTATVLIEGPYGGPGHTMFDSFSGAVLVAGGSGITYSLATVQDLVRKDIAGRSRVKIIEMVWIIQDAGSLLPMLPTFVSLLQQVVFTELRISVHYTRASSTSMDTGKIFGCLPPKLTIVTGRPRFSNILNAVVDRSCALFTPAGVENRVSDKLSGVIVSVCGPEGLGNDLRKAIGSVDPRRYKAVGGVELCEDVFGW